MKDIKNYEGLYAVTSCGRVYSYKRRRFLKPVCEKNGYLRVCLCRDGEIKWYLVHRLVAEAFIPNPDNLPQINHKDENKANNCLQNLEWCDAKYNNNYGTHIEKIKKPILQYALNGEFVREWQSATDVGIVARYNINKCLIGKTKTAYGFIWKYRE